MEVIDVNIKPIYTQVAGVIVWLDLYGLSAWIVVKLDIYFRWEIYHGAQTDVGNREFLHEYNAVCGKTGVKHHCRTTLNLKSSWVYYVSLMNSQKLNGESTPNILVNEAV